MKENINTEAAILKAAETLFKEKGFKGTTTTLIAGQAGVTHAMLHYYFRTKEQIFTKVLDGYIKKMHDNFKQSMSHTSLDDTICSATASLFDFFREHQGEMKVILEVAENHPDMLDKYREGVHNMLTTAFAKHDERISAAAQSGDTEVLPMSEIIETIIFSTYSTFALLPLARLVLTGDLDSFLEHRKQQTIEAVRCMTQKKHDK